MKAPKKPKLKSLPKQPKANASAQTWKNYENKISSIENDNKKLIAEYKKKKAIYESALKKREQIKNKANKIKSLSGTI